MYVVGIVETVREWFKWKYHIGRTYIHTDRQTDRGDDTWTFSSLLLLWEALMDQGYTGTDGTVWSIRITGRPSCPLGSY